MDLSTTAMRDKHFGSVSKSLLWGSQLCHRIETAMLLMQGYDMDTEEIENAVRTFRSVMDEYHGDFRPEFVNFPRGCCGAVAELLAAFLKDEGLGTFAYVSGWREGRTASQSHAWLESEDLIIDATADQFEGQQENFLFTLDSTLHKRFQAKRERREDGDFRLMLGTDNLHIYYRALQKALRDKEPDQYDKFL